MELARIRLVGGISIVAAVVVGLAVLAADPERGAPRPEAADGTAGAASDASAAATVAPYAYASGQPTLFRVQQAPASSPPPHVGGDIAPVPVQVSRDAAMAGARGGQLDIALPDGTHYPVRFEREERAPGGNWTFVGRVDTPAGPLAAVLTFGPAGAFGVLPTPDGRMLHLSTSAGQAWLAPAGGIVPPGGDPGVPRDFLVPPQAPDPGSPAAAAPRIAPPGVAPLAGLPLGTGHATGPGHAGPTRVGRVEQAATPAQAPVAAQAEPIATVTLLGVYTSNLVTLRGSVIAVTTEFNNLVAIANQAHMDSGSRIRVELVGLMESDFPADRFNDEALQLMTDNQLPDGTDVHAERNRLQADLVAMLRPYATNDFSCGIAWLGGYGGTGPSGANPDYGYSVSAVNPCGPLVLAHELGHNMGSMHDIETSTDPGGTISYGAFRYSFGYRQYGPAFATVMAYSLSGQTWVGRFSHPGSTLCLGAACGIAEEADNVRSLNRMADTIARYRDPPGVLSVRDALAMERPDGFMDLEFVVRLSTPAPPGGVSFDIATTGGTATPGVDYVPMSATGVVIPEGEVFHLFGVTVLDDTLKEGEETVTVGVTNVTGATAIDASATGYIIDDDPRVRVSGRVLMPPDTDYTGPAWAWVIVQAGMQEEYDLFLEAPDYAYAVDVPYGSDVSISVSLPEPLLAEPALASGVTKKTTLDVQVVRGAYLSGKLRWDKGGEPGPIQVVAWNYMGDGWGLVQPVQSPAYDYNFLVMPGANITLEARYAPVPYFVQLLEVGRLSGDATRDIRMRKIPSLTIPHLLVPEMDAMHGFTDVYVPVSLSAPAPAGGVTLDVEVEAVTAEPGDYATIPNRVTIPAGANTATAVVRVFGDDRREPDELLWLKVANIAGAAWSPGPGSLTIVDDDGYRAVSDFNGDGRSDILWRNDANGRNGIWLHAQHGVQQPVTNITNLAWRMDGVGDFDGDGRADIFWRNHATGANGAWRGGDYGDQIRMTGVSNLDWEVVAVGDFNDNGRDDLFWRNRTTGANVIWDGGDSKRQTRIAGVADTGWQVVGVGDFDGDGRDDLFWRHVVRGANNIWLGADHLARMPVANVSGAAWTVVGVGDLDGDDRADVVWRHGVTGRNVVWFGADRATLRDLATVASQAWQVQAVGDYDGDGIADLLWRNGSTGANQVWRGGDHKASMVLTRITNLDWDVKP